MQSVLIHGLGQTSSSWVKTIEKMSMRTQVDTIRKSIKISYADGICERQIHFLTDKTASVLSCTEQLPFF